MPGNDLFFFREVTGKLLDHVDGTVLSTRAAERNSKVTPVVAPEGGQPFFDKFTDVFQQLGDVSLRFEKFDNRLVFSGQWPQSHVVIRVRQASYVKNNVCIKWDTEFETEGFEMKRQRRLFDFDQFLDPVAQFVRVGVRRVDHLSDHLDVGHHGTFFPDGFHQRPVIGEGSPLGQPMRQGMASPCFRKTVNQRMVVGCQKQDVNTMSLILEFNNTFRQATQRCSASGVYRDSQFVLVVFQSGFDKSGKQDGRQIIDTKITGVFSAFKATDFPDPDIPVMIMICML